MMSDPVRRRDLKLRWQLGILTATGGVMRLALVLVATPGYDESYTHMNFVVPSWWTALSNYSLPNNHVLHSLAARAAHVLTNGGLTATRLPALIAGVLVIPLTGVLTYRLTSSRSSAVIAAAVVTVWPQMIWHSADARGYTMVSMFAVLLALISHRLMQHDRRPRHWLAWSTVMAAGALTVPIFLYPAAGIGLWLLVGAWRKDHLNRQFVLRTASAGLLAGLLTIAGYSPVLKNNGLEAIIANRFVTPRTWSEWTTAFASYLNEVVDWGLLGVPNLIGFLLIALMAASLLGRNRSSETHLLLTALVLVTLAIMAIQRVTPFPRVWLFLIPFLSAAVGASIRLPRRFPASGLLVAFLMLVIGSFAVQLPDTESRLRSVESVPDIEAVVRIAAAAYPEGARLLVGPSEIPQYQYAVSRHPGVSLDGRVGIVVVVNHRLGYELTELLEGSGLDARNAQLLVRLPNTTLFTLPDSSV
jgi:4-amino-4-deoxy-L-arabinose transferase-like glycosyltransferase